MKWSGCKNKDGRIPLAPDNRPWAYKSECGRFVVARAMTASGEMWDAWFKPSETAAGQPLNDRPLTSREEATKMAREYLRNESVAAAKG